MDKGIELAESVKVWWETHKYDVEGDYGEYNVYNSEPDFVIKAKKIIGNWEVTT